MLVRQPCTSHCTKQFSWRSSTREEGRFLQCFILCFLWFFWLFFFKKEIKSFLSHPKTHTSTLLTNLAAESLLPWSRLSAELCSFFLNFLKGGFPRVFGVGDLRPTARPWGAAGAMGGGEAEEGSQQCAVVWERRHERTACV